MEVVLLRIVTECAGKHEAVKASAQEAYDLIVSQQINPIVEMHVLREKYLTAIELALDVKGSRLPQCGIDGLQLLLRDNQLHSLEGTKETTEQSLPMQALHTLHCMPSWNQEPEIQCHCLTLVVQLMCSPQWIVTLEAIKVALELCLSTYGSTRQPSVHLAVRASITQILNTFCTGLYKEQAEDAADDDYKHVFADVTDLLSHCTQKLTVMTSSTDEAVVVIDAINTIVSAQALVVQKHEPFIVLLWRDLCPAIVKLLGDPMAAASQRKTDADESAPVGQGQSASVGYDQTIFESPDIARAVYFLCGELLRLMAPMEGMHSALEALFHKALLFPKVEHRTEALKVFKKILSSPDRVVDILLTSLNADSQNESLTLWKILLDSIVECSCSEQLDISVAAVQCVNGLLASLTTLCNNDTDILPPEVVDRTHRNFKTLKSADLPVFKYASADECRKRLLLPQLSIDHDSQAGDSVVHTPTSQTPVVEEAPVAIDSATPPVATDDGEEKEKDTDMDSRMSSLAQRIGSALGGNNADLRQQFQYVQTALKKDDERLSPRSADEDESATARRFVQTLIAHIPSWMKMRSGIEVDEAIQQFASDFYKEFTEQQEAAFLRNVGHEVRVLNADALYLTAYASIRVVVRHNKKIERETDISEDSFVEEIFGSGCIIFASEAMIRSIYRGLLEHCTADMCNSSGVLMDVIEDYDGMSFLQMADVNKLEKAARNTNVTLHCSAAKKMSRRLLTASWDGLVVVLSNLAEAVRVEGAKSLSFFVHSLLHKSSGRQRAQTALIVDGLSASLRGLHRLAHLCNTLSLRFRSGWIFGKLVEVSCPLDELRALSSAERSQQRGKKRVQSQQEKLRKWTLRRQDALSIEIVLDEAINNGTHAPDCWKHVIRCTEYIWELEHYLFGSCGEQQNPKVVPKANSKEKTESAKERRDSDGDDRPSAVRLAHLAPMIGPAQQSVEEVLGNETADVLTAETAARVLCLLIAKTDRFYECVTRSLNLRALRQFILSLLTASEGQLLYTDDEGSGLVDRCTLLRRLGVTIVDLASTGRPLVHSMHIWPVCTLHMIQAACAGQPVITASAIACLHDCVASLLSTEAEGFRFHEALFAPFQSILCLDMCDEETQDQIVCILAEFVDTNADQIGSGWRPLFGALKAVRTSPGGANDSDVNQLRQAHTTVLDVFSAFLRMENRGVFCMAALDCINCLVHYLQATDRGTEANGETDDVQEDEDAREVAVSRSALSYLVQIHKMLRTLYSMNRLPVCHLLHRLLLRERAPQSVDETIECFASHMDDIASLSSVLIEEPFFGSPGHHPSAVDLDQEIENVDCPLPWIGLPVTQLAIVEVWLTLVEGLTGVAVTCPRSVQPELLQTLSDMIDSLRSCPGPDFGAYCLSHLVLPMLQNWIRREAVVGDGGGWRENRPSVRNFKQAFGLYTEVIVGFVRHDAARPTSHRLLFDMYRLINECIAQPSEFVSRLGCSCLRHLITGAGPAFGEPEWTITVHALWKTTCVTLHQLRLLMAHFFPGSNEYYGDCGLVQVALRKDSNPREASRVRALAQQVFLLDNQKFVENLEDRPDLLSQSDRSVVFLLNREKLGNEESIVHRLPFRDVVVLLLSHQLLLQLIGSLLVEGTDLIVSGVGSLLLKQLVSASSAAKSRKASLPGVLPKLGASNITTLFMCLDASFQVAYEFDRRPGLKFLVQKVFNSTVAANLYKQTVTAWTLRSVAMFEFVRRVEKSSKDIWAMFKDWGDDASFEPAALSQDTDYLLRLADAFRRVCREMCRVERTVAAEKPIVVDEHLEPLAFVLASPDILPTSSALLSATGGEDSAESDVEADDDKEVVYSVVTTEKVNDMIAEYKRRKQKATMPSTPPRARANPFRQGQGADEGNGDANGCLEEELKESRLKDGDARCLAWSEMTLGLVHLVISQPTPCFKKLLPVFYKSLMLLTAGSTDVRIRQTMADVLALLEETFHFLESD